MKELVVFCFAGIPIGFFIGLFWSAIHEMNHEDKLRNQLKISFCPTMQRYRLRFCNICKTNHYIEVSKKEVD